MLNKDETAWIENSEVTREAILAVAEYMLEHDDEMAFIYNGEEHRLKVT